jgi:hypothetical protein
LRGNDVNAKVKVVPAVGREPVGEVPAEVGRLTTQGPITAIAEQGVVFLGHPRRASYTFFLLVLGGEAVKFGWPNCPGCRVFGHACEPLNPQLETGSYLATPGSPIGQLTGFGSVVK